MTECAICGAHVEQEDAATVTVEHTRKDRYGREQEYLLHSSCAERVFGGWRKP